MTEAVLHALLFGLGLTYTLPASRETGLPFAVAAAYPVGLLLWVVAMLASLVAPVSLFPAALTVGLALLAGVGLARTLSTLRQTRGGALGRLAAGCAGFLLAAILFSELNLAVLTVDSFTYIGAGRSLATFADPSALAGVLTNVGVFQVLVQSASIPIGVPYLHAASPLLAVSGIACFVVLGRRGRLALGDAPDPGRGPWRETAIVVLAAVAMASPYFMVAQALYVHTNYAAAIYLLLACATFWLAEVEDRDAWLPFAFAFLVAFSLQRLELPVYGALFAAIACAETSRQSRWLRWGPWLFALVIVPWYAYLSTLSSEETRLLAWDRALFVMTGVAALPVVAHLVRSGVARHLRPWLAPCAVGLPLAAVVASVAFVPERMEKTFSGLVSHFIHPAWGVTWLAILLLGIATLRARPIPLGRLFSHGGAASLCLIALTGAARAGGYHGGLTDSGNRMLTHLVPVAFFFFAVSLGRARAGHEPSSR